MSFAIIITLLAYNGVQILKNIPKVILKYSKYVFLLPEKMTLKLNTRFFLVLYCSSLFDAEYLTTGEKMEPHSSSRMRGGGGSDKHGATQ